MPPAGDHSSIKHWPEDERPRERLIRYGEDKLSDANLLGILIGSGDRQSRKNAVDLSRDLLRVFGGFRSLDQATVNELCQIKGIGAAKAAQIKAALLDPKMNLIKECNISEGSLNSSIVHPREVMIPAIKESAAAIALVHNHPSGDPTPSQQDIEITHRISKTRQIIGIRLVDHVIIGGGTYYSFSDEGLL
jgi:DNA repair protein RadC